MASKNWLTAKVNAQVKAKPACHACRDAQGKAGTAS